MLFMDARNHWHILSHCYVPHYDESNDYISGHLFSEDGLTWNESNVEPYRHSVNFQGGQVQNFSTLERPKLIVDASGRPTHLFNGVSSRWPCSPCGGCTSCKVAPGTDWTYTLVRETELGHLASPISLPASSHSAMPALKTDGERREVVVFHSGRHPAAPNLKTDDTAAKKCSCANASLCRPLAHGPPPHGDVHVWSDCGGPWQTPTSAGNTSCNWRDFDFSTLTTIGRDVGHSLGVRADGGVNVGGFGTWPDSELVCHAHAHDVRVINAVLPYLDQIYPKSSRPSNPCFYQKLLANTTAHERLARELIVAVKDAGMDGIE